MRGTMTWLLRASLALTLLTPMAAAAQTAPAVKPVRTTGGAAVMPAASVQTCDATSMDSPPAKAFMAAQGWRYATPAAATAAYLALVNNQSPWPDWYVPTSTNPATKGVLVAPPITTLPVGTRFQMALQAGQKTDAPGGWGTFDYIASVEDVREFLAVTHAFKSNPDRVVTYEVTQLLPVIIGPIGPQVDAQTCEYLPGRWSQFNMVPAWNEVNNYLKVVEVRNIQ
jgi:hypothetical protein